MKVKFKKLRSGVKTPVRATKGSGAYDIFANLNYKALKDFNPNLLIDRILYQKDLLIFPNNRVIVPTGIAVELPQHHYDSSLGQVGWILSVRPRSGLSKLGLKVANSPGTIDEDYRGEIGIILENLSNKEMIIRDQMRIAQIVLQQVFSIEWEEVGELSETERGSGGFGHTGV